MDAAAVREMLSFAAHKHRESPKVHLTEKALDVLSKGRDSLITIDFAAQIKDQGNFPASDDRHSGKCRHL